VIYYEDDSDEMKLGGAAIIIEDGIIIDVLKRDDLEKLESLDIPLEDVGDLVIMAGYIK